MFLQGWRPAIIPIVAIPVSLVGTFAAMAALGFAINNLTLFGLVLAVGIVVDDAIVVVENVERHLAHGLSRRDAALRTMEEVGGALVSIALVLCAVFVPTAFLGGITGQFFQQFAGFDCVPVSVEITYGTERLASYIQGVDDVFDVMYAPGISYRDLFQHQEYENSAYGFEAASYNTATLVKRKEDMLAPVPPGAHPPVMTQDAPAGAHLE